MLVTLGFIIYLVFSFLLMIARENYFDKYSNKNNLLKLHDFYNPLSTQLIYNLHKINWMSKYLKSNTTNKCEYPPNSKLEYIAPK